MSAETKKPAHDAWTDLSQEAKEWILEHADVFKTDKNTDENGSAEEHYQKY